MIRRILFAAVLMTGGAVVFAAQSATFVLKSGERVSGLLGYNGGYDVTLSINGQDRLFLGAISRSSRWCPAIRPLQSCVRCRKMTTRQNSSAT